MSTPGPDGYPVTRGTYLAISPNETFLWTQGSVKGVHMDGPNRDVYKEGALKPVPSPLIVRRFSGSGGWFETCSGIIGLTKIDWNNNTLYKKLPVTLEYSQRFARIIQQNQTSSTQSSTSGISCDRRARPPGLATVAGHQRQAPASLA